MLLIVSISTVLFSLVLSLVTIAKRDYASGLTRIPNAHFTVPFSRLWLLVVRWRSIEHRTRVDIHRRLGPVVRIGPREISVDCVDDGIRLIYGSKFAKDGRFYGAFVHDCPILFTMIDNNEHKNRKKMLSHVYSKSYILTSEMADRAISVGLDRFQEKLSRWADSDVPVDALGQSKACLFDIVTDWLYGAEGVIDSFEDKISGEEFSAVNDLRFEGLFWRSEFGWLKQSLHLLGVNTISKAAHAANDRLGRWITQMNARAYDLHENNLINASPTANVYDHLYDHLKDANQGMSHNDIHRCIAAEFDDHLSAGHAATGIAVTYAMYELSRCRDQQRRLRDELRTLTKQNTPNSARRIDDLPVLDAVVTETLRVWSPNPGPWPRIVPDSGCRLASRYDIPIGTIVSSSSWTLHRNPVLFPCPNEWRPERWLEVDENTQREMRKWMWAFGSGPRQCIGINFAIRVIKEILVAVYTDYETLLDENSKESVEQADAITAGPITNCLNLKFRRHRYLSA